MLNDKDYEERLSELRQIKIDVDYDLLSKDPLTLGRKLVEVQAYKDRVSSLLAEAISNKSEAEILYEREKRAYELEVDKLLVNDDDVKSQKSERLRIAQANVKLSEHLLRVHAALLALLRAESYLKCVQTIYNNLDSVNQNLDQQIYIIQLCLKTGILSQEDFPKIRLGGNHNE